MSRLRVAVVCVADCKTKYLYQALRLVFSVRNLKSRHHFTVIVGIFDSTPQYFEDLLHRLGAQVIKLKQYSSAHGPSNKMSVLRSRKLNKFDAVLLCDCDVIFVDEFDDIIESNAIQAKIADLKTIPDEIIRNIFEFCGVPFPSATFNTTLDRQSSILYCNAGFIIIPKTLFDAFVDSWFKWNDLLLLNRVLLERFTFFTDQASLSLTLNEFREEFRELGIGLNFPLHLPEAMYPEFVHSIRPQVIHYHDFVDPLTGLVRRPRWDNVWEKIKGFNDGFAADAELVSGAVFWDQLYDNTLIEGDNRQNTYKYRAGLARQVLSELEPESIVDFGCGRTPMFGGFLGLKYHGIDCSKEAILAAKLNDPIGNYSQADIIVGGGNSTGDLVVLLDVLPYLRAAGHVESAIRNAAKASNQLLLVSGLQRAVDQWNRPRSFFYKPVSDLLSEIGGFEFVLIGGFGEQAVFLGSKVKTNHQ